MYKIKRWSRPLTWKQSGSSVVCCFLWQQDGSSSSCWHDGGARLGLSVCAQAWRLDVSAGNRHCSRTLYSVSRMKGRLWRTCWTDGGGGPMVRRPAESFSHCHSQHNALLGVCQNMRLPAEAFWYDFARSSGLVSGPAAWVLSLRRPLTPLSSHCGQQPKHPGGPILCVLGLRG